MADKQFTTIDEYIETFPDNVQGVLEKVRRTIHKTVPEAVETISYGIPTFRLNDTYLVYFSGWQKHISVYPRPRGDAAFEEEIAPYASGKGTLQFPLDKPIPYELIEKIVLLLLQESANRKS